MTEPRDALRTIAEWQTHGALRARDAEAMAEIARAALDASPTPDALAEMGQAATRAFTASRTYIDGKVTLDADIFDDLVEAGLRARTSPIAETSQARADNVSRLIQWGVLPTDATAFVDAILAARGQK